MRRERERERMRERDKNFPRACSCVFLTLNAAFAQEERYITQTHTSFLSVQKFSRLNYVRLEKSRKVNNNFGENSKHFPS